MRNIIECISAFSYLELNALKYYIVLYIRSGRSLSKVTTRIIYNETKLDNKPSYDI